MSDIQITYRIDEPKIAVEDFDGEFVVLNLESGQYFSFADSSALVWKALSSGLTVQELISALDNNSARAEEIKTFCKKIIEAGLLVPCTSIEAATNNELSALIAASSGPLIIEAYDDLAALLVADPIHDVEREAGWPHTSEQQA